MKIGIDARMYGPQTRGIGRYIQKTIEYLENNDPENEYIIFLYSENFDDYIPKNKNFKKILAPWRWYTLKEQIHFLNLIKKHKLDLMHFPHFNVPILYRKPFIVTIHDLIIMQDTQERATTLGPIIYKIKKFFYKKIIKNALNKSKKIIAVSKCTAQDITNIFKIDKNKIQVIYEGIDVTKGINSQIDSKQNLRYNIKKPYLLYIGSAYPHKNLERLIKVIEDLNKNTKINLVLIGKKDFFYKRLEKETNSPNVFFLGYVKDKYLPQIFNGSEAYIFPSRYEGFGLPPLSAMSHGCPVLSSNKSCLPEILQDAAEFFDPNDNESIKNCILKILISPSLKEKLIEKGYLQTQKYSWYKSGKQTLELFKDCIENFKYEK